MSTVGSNVKKFFPDKMCLPTKSRSATFENGGGLGGGGGGLGLGEKGTPPRRRDQKSNTVNVKAMTATTWRARIKKVAIVQLVSLEYLWGIVGVRL